MFFMRLLIGLLIVLSVFFCFKQMNVNPKQDDLGSEKVGVRALPDAKEFFSSKNQFRINLENDYLRSLFPVMHSMPRYTVRDFARQNYIRVFEDNYPYLSGALKVNTNYRLYDISRFKETPKVYIGLPKYLRQENVTDVNSKITMIKLDVLKIIMEHKLDKYLDYTENYEDADIFVFPIYFDTSLIIKDRLIVSSHPRRYPNLIVDNEKDLKNVD